MFTIRSELLRRKCMTEPFLTLDALLIEIITCLLDYTRLNCKSWQIILFVKCDLVCVSYNGVSCWL